MALPFLRKSFVIIACLLLFWQLFSNARIVIDSLDELKPFWLMLAMMTLAPVYFLAAFCWYVIVGQLGGQVSWKKALGVWVESNLTRYVPGVIWQYLGKIYLGSIAGITKNVSVTALVMEILLVVDAALVTWFILSPLSPFPLDVPLLLLVFVIPLLLLPLVVPQLLQLLLSKLAFLLGYRQTITMPVKNWLFLKTLPLYMANFGFNGLALFLIIKSMIDIPYHLIPAIIAVYAISWLIGYVTIFAPGGLGATELSLSLLLSAYIPTSIAVLVALILRLLLIITEVITLAITVRLIGRWKGSG